MTAESETQALEMRMYRDKKKPAVDLIPTCMLLRKAFHDTVHTVCLRISTIFRKNSSAPKAYRTALYALLANWFICVPFCPRPSLYFIFTPYSRLEVPCVYQERLRKRLPYVSIGSTCLFPLGEDSHRKAIGCSTPHLVM